MDDYIYRQMVIDTVRSYYDECNEQEESIEERIAQLPSADVEEVVRCKDCVFGHLYVDVQNGVTDSWIECRNPEGLNRDVSVDGYCSASIRKM